MRDRRAPTDIVVTVLDVAPVDEAMTKAYRKAHEDDTEATVEVGFGPYGIVDTPAGAFVLNQEGVGVGPVPDDEPYEFDGYVHRPNSIGMFPEMTAKLTVAEMRGLATDSRVNLADFVRTFGARLDRNYDEFRRAIEQAEGR